MASFFNDAKKFLGVGSRADLKEGVPPPSMSKSDQVGIHVLSKLPRTLGGIAAIVFNLESLTE